MAEAMAELPAKFEEKIVRVICLDTIVETPVRMLIVGKSLNQHKIVDLDFTRFIDRLRFDPFEPGAKTTVHLVKVDFWVNEPARELLCGCEGILTNHLSSKLNMTSAKLEKIFEKLGLDSEA
jgi:hypothetical protein